jgi:hypothetical protein
MAFISEEKTGDSESTALTDKLPALYVVILEARCTFSTHRAEGSGGWVEVLYMNSS